MQVEPALSGPQVKTRVWTAGVLPTCSGRLLIGALRSVMVAV